MKLILHQAMTDIRAERWLVAAWAAMLLASCTIEALKLEGSLGFALAALAPGRVVLGWVLAIRIVHADPLDGTSAFWLTRPLSPRMLLAAKCGLIGALLLAVPAIGALVVFMTNGVAFGALPGLLPEWLLLEALPLLPIVLVATLTRDLARMVLTLIVSFVFWCGLQYYCLFRSIVPLEYREVPGWYWAVARAWLVVGAGVVALSATLIARQYLTRRTARIAFAALVAALGIAVIAALWPIRLMSEYAQAARWEDAPTASAAGGWSGAAGITVTIPEGNLRLMTWTFPNALYRLIGDFRVDGLEQDVIVAVDEGRGTLRFPKEGDVFEERYVRAVGSYVGLWGMADEASRRNFERVVGARFLGRAPAWGNGLHVIGLEQGVYKRHLGSPAVYEGDLVLDAYRVAEAATMPLKAGASGRAGDVETTILAIRQESTHWVIDMREATPRLVLPGESNRIVRIARNRKRGQSLVLWDNNRRVPPSALASTAVIAGRTTAVLDRPPSKQGVPLDAAWLDDAELVFVSFERLARFTKHVTISNFVLPEAPVTREGGKAGGGGR
jgi:hypothetical protein